MEDRFVRLSAKFFAHGAHAGQVRKYTGEPYVDHCIEVAELVESTGGNFDDQAIAVLHDVVEDTEATYEQVLELFGVTVAEGVKWLTDYEYPEGEAPNRATRKAKDRDRMAEAPSNIQTIKVCDLVSNTATIVEHDPKFAKTYLPEKAALLRVMTGAHEGMVTTAWRQLQEASDALGIDIDS